MSKLLTITVWGRISQFSPDTKKCHHYVKTSYDNNLRKNFTV